jgi:hypothetical protein
LICWTHHLATQVRDSCWGPGNLQMPVDVLCDLLPRPNGWTRVTNAQMPNRSRGRQLKTVYTKHSLYDASCPHRWRKGLDRVTRVKLRGAKKRPRDLKRPSNFAINITYHVCTDDQQLSVLCFAIWPQGACFGSPQRLHEVEAAWENMLTVQMKLVSFLQDRNQSHISNKLICSISIDVLADRNSAT